MSRSLSSVPATIERLFGLAPLTARDAAAKDVLSLASLPAPRADTSEIVARSPGGSDTGSPGRAPRGHTDRRGRRARDTAR